MPRFKPKGMLERSAAEDLWRHTLSKIPSIYGRLAYLASLRDPNSGLYHHYGLRAAFGREESGKALKESHERAFAEWLNLSLAGKNEDLATYLSTLDDPRQVVINFWLQSKTYRAQIPSSALEMERELFVQDLQALLETVRNGWSEAPRGQASLPPA
jgi:hypothetical protein